MMAFMRVLREASRQENGSARAKVARRQIALSQRPGISPGLGSDL
jgi:hypothetical protein